MVLRNFQERDSAPQANHRENTDEARFSKAVIVNFDPSGLYIILITNTRDFTSTALLGQKQSGRGHTLLYESINE